LSFSLLSVILISEEKERKKRLTETIFFLFSIRLRHHFDVAETLVDFKQKVPTNAMRSRYIAA
jgi:hypothetical protein